MKIPYKYPYLSMFIIGYYFLEHEGYYYKIRNYFGYSLETKVNYIMSLTDEALQNLTSINGRKALVLYWKEKDEAYMDNYMKLARHFKEKYRSPIMFTERFCSENDLVCKENTSPFYVTMKDGQILEVLSGQLDKKSFKKKLHELTKS